MQNYLILDPHGKRKHKLTNDENNYKQGYHDAIERAILWFQLRSEYPISRLEDSFKNFMEE